MPYVSKECWNEWISKKAVANAGIVVIDTHNRALLLFKAKYQEWEIPSGAIDKDEDPKDTAIRELAEEAHIKVTREQLFELGVVTAKHPDRTEDKTDVIVTFVARGDAKVTLDNEEGHTKYRWLPLQQFDDPKVSMHTATREQIKMAFTTVHNLPI